MCRMEERPQMSIFHPVFDHLWSHFEAHQGTRIWSPSEPRKLQVYSQQSHLGWNTGVQRCSFYTAWGSPKNYTMTGCCLGVSLQRHEALFSSGFLVDGRLCRPWQWLIFPFDPQQCPNFTPQLCAGEIPGSPFWLRWRRPWHFFCCAPPLAGHLSHLWWPEMARDGRCGVVMDEMDKRHVRHCYIIYSSFLGVSNFKTCKHLSWICAGSLGISFLFA